jgi:hypothetical protein
MAYFGGDSLNISMQVKKNLYFFVAPFATFFFTISFFLDDNEFFLIITRQNTLRKIKIQFCFNS